MQFDSDLVDSDPLLVPELHQMADDARGHLHKLIDRVVHPSGSGPRWFYKGKELDIQSPSDLRRALSKIVQQVYVLTPKINNELIVRHKPSAVVVNARKKLLLGILERSGQKNLGIEGNFPDSSMFRTVLLHPGLYDQDDNGKWRYAMPEDVTDKGLKAVWGKIRAFLTEPSPSPKNIKAFFEMLIAPPFGLREGVLPILLAAGLKAFPSALSLMKEGEYVADVLPSEIEQLCREPDRYHLIVLDLGDSKRQYLEGFYRCFAGKQIDDVPDGDLIRQCFDALSAWKSQLPPAALTTKRLSEHTRRFQEMVQRSIDPVRLLFERIPQALLGYSLREPEELLIVVQRCKRELDDVVNHFRLHAVTSLRRAIAVGVHGKDGNIREVADRWAACFPADFVKRLTDGVAKGLLARMRMSYDTDTLFIDSLASLLVGKSTSRWDDSNVAAFDREVQNVVRRIEESALSMDADLKESGAAVQGLANLVTGRIEELLAHLEGLVGAEQAQVLIGASLKREMGEYGDTQGSIRKSAG